MAQRAAFGSNFNITEFNDVYTDIHGSIAKEITQALKRSILDESLQSIEETMIEMDQLPRVIKEKIPQENLVSWELWEKFQEGKYDLVFQVFGLLKSNNLFRSSDRFLEAAFIFHLNRQGHAQNLEPAFSAFIEEFSQNSQNGLTQIQQLMEKIGKSSLAILYYNLMVHLINFSVKKERDPLIEGLKNLRV